MSFQDDVDREAVHDWLNERENVREPPPSPDELEGLVLTGERDAARSTEPRLRLDQARP